MHYENNNSTELIKSPTRDPEVFRIKLPTNYAVRVIGILDERQQILTMYKGEKQILFASKSFSINREMLYDEYFNYDEIIVSYCGTVFRTTRKYWQSNGEERKFNNQDDTQVLLPIDEFKPDDDDAADEIRRKIFFY